MANNKIMFDVGFNVDKSSLNTLQQSVQQIQQMSQHTFASINKTTNNSEMRKEMVELQQMAARVGEAMERAYNPKLGTVNFSAFRKEIQLTQYSLQQMQSGFAKFGPIGDNAFRSVAHSMGSANIQLKEAHTLLNKMTTTLVNTVKWNVASSAINSISQHINSAYSYVKGLDTALNSIQIVTQKSADDMDRFAQNANKAAQALGSTTTAYAKGALTFYQQGLDDEEVLARTDLTTKVQNVTGLSAEDSAQYVTSVLNGYKVGSEEAEHAMDKLAAVGAHTASSLAELSEGMAKVASSASAMGVTEDQLAATLSTVISVTRQDASSVGTAFKTIYARMSAIKAGTDEAEVSLGQYTQKMKEVGINVLDSSGELRDMGEVMEEIGGKWGTMTREQQLYLAQTMAGTRQYNNLIALFDNWSNYMDSLNVSMHANGTLQEQQQTYMESTAAHLKQLRAASEGVYDSILDPKAINSFASIFTALLKGLEQFIDGIGGGSTVLAGFGALFFNVFNKQIAGSITTFITNAERAKQQEMALVDALKAASEISAINGLDKETEQINKLNTEVNTLAKSGALSNEEFQKLKNTIDGVFNAAQNKGQVHAQGQELTTQVQKDLTRYNQLAGANTQEYNKAITWDSQLSKGVQDVAQLEKTAEALRQQQTIVQELSDAYRAVTEASQGYFKKVSAGGDKAISTVEKWSSELKKQAHLYVSSTGDNETFNKIEQSIRKVDAELKSANPDFDKLAGSLKNITSILGKEFNTASTVATKDADLLDGEIKQLTKDATTAGNALNKSLDFSKSSIGIAQFKNNLANAQQLFSGLMSAAFALQSAMNIPSIIKNDDLSSMEKALQLTISVTMAVTMMGTAVKQLAAGWAFFNGEVMAFGVQKITSGIIGLTGSLSNLTKMIQGLAVAVKSGNAEKLTSIALYDKEAFAQQRKAVLDAKEALTIAKKELAEKIALKTEKEKIGVMGVVTTEEIAAAEAKVADAEASLGDALANQGLAASFVELTGAIGAFLVTAAPYIFILGAIALGVYAVNEAIHAKQKALEEANEGLVLANQHLQDATSSLQGLKSSLDDIQSKGDALKDLTKGTLEYNAALLEANQAIRDFAEEYDLAFEKDYTIKDGVYEITDAGKATAQGKANKRVADASLEYYVADKKVDTAQLDIDLDNLKKTVVSDLVDESGLFKDTESKEIASKLDNLTAAADTSETVSVLESLLATGKLSEESEAAIKQTNAEIAQNTAKEDGELEAAIRQYWANNSNFNNMSTEEQNAFIDNEVKKAESFDISSISREDIFGKAEGTWGNTTSYNLDEVSPELINYLKQQNDNIGEITRLYIQSGKLVADYIDKEDGSEKTGKEAAHFNEETTFEILGLLKQYAGSFGNTNLDNVNVQTYMSQNNIKAADSAWTGSINKVLATEGEGLTDKITKYYYDNKEELQEQGYETAYDFIRAFIKALGDSVENIDMASVADLVNKKINEEGIESSNKKYGNITSVQVDEETGGLQMQYSGGKTASVLENKDGSYSMGDITYSKNKDGEYLDQYGRKAGEETVGVIEDYINVVEQGLAERKNEEEVSKAEQMALDAGVTQEELLDATQRLEEAYDLDHEMAQQIAADNLKLVKGVEKLKEGYGEWEDSLKSISGKTGKELQKALAVDPKTTKNFNAYKESMSEILDIPLEELSDEFLTQADTIELAKKAADGDTEALNELYRSAASFDLSQIEFEDEGLAQEVQDAIDNFDFDNIEIGTEIKDIDDANFQNALVKMQQDAYTTTEDINKILSAMGFEPEWDYKEVRAEQLADIKSSGKITLDDGTEVAANVGSIEETATGIYRVPYLKGGTFRGAPAKPAGATAGKGSGGGGGGKKGGGKKSGKAKDPIKKEKSKKDIYHDINIELEKRKKVLEDLQKAEEQLTDPKDIIKNLEKQKEALDKLNESYEKKVQIARKEAAQQRKNLKKDYGAKFDSDGNISNYFQIVNEFEKRLEAARKKYNKNKTDKNKEAYDKIKEEYDDFLSDLGDYEGTLDTLDEIGEALAENVREQLDIKLKGLTAEVEVALETKEFYTKWNEFKRKYIDHLADDSIKGQLQEAWGNILDTVGNDITDGVIKKETETLTNLINMYQSGATGSYVDPRTKKTIYLNNKGDVLEAIKNQIENGMGSIEDLYEQAQRITDAYLDSIDAVIESRSAIVESYDMIREQSEHNIKMIELFYGEDAYDLTNEQIRKQNAAIGNQLKALESNAARSMEELQKAMTLPDDDPNKIALIDKWKDALQNDLSEIQGHIEEWGDNVIQIYENSVDSIIKKMNEALTDGLDLDIVGEEYDLVKGNQDDYLDLVNRAYALDKLRGAWKDIIDSDTSEQVQRDVNKAMNEQLGLLEQKGELTQSDIDRAYLELEIMKKQIALQDAQANKSKMRLRRDANGNYSYQFVSDADATRQAAQELADAKNELYNFDKNRYEENLKSIYDTWSEFSQKMAEASKKYANDEAKRTEYLTMLQEQYNEKVARLSSQGLEYRKIYSDTMVEEVASLYDIAEETLDKQREHLFAEVNKLTNTTAQTFVEKLGGDGFSNLVAGAISSLNNALSEYRTSMTALQNYDDLKNKTLEEANSIMQEIVNKMNLLAEKDFAMAGEEYQKMIDFFNSEEVKAMIKGLTDALTVAKDVVYGKNNDSVSVGGDENAITIAQTSIDSLSETMTNAIQDVIDATTTTISSAVSTPISSFVSSSAEILSGVNTTLSALNTESALMSTLSSIDNNILAIKNNTDSIKSKIVTNNNNEITFNVDSLNTFKQIIDQLGLGLNQF